MSNYLFVFVIVFSLTIAIVGARNVCPVRVKDIDDIDIFEPQPAQNAFPALDPLQISSQLEKRNYFDRMCSTVA